jgi:hypothetical protein
VIEDRQIEFRVLSFEERHALEIRARRARALYIAGLLGRAGSWLLARLGGAGGALGWATPRR